MYETEAKILNLNPAKLFWGLHINIWGNCIGSTKQNSQPQPCKNILRPTYFPRHNVPPVKCLKIITNRSPVHNMQTYPARKRGGGLIQQQLISGEYIIQISKKTGWGSHPPTNQNVKSPNSSGSITLIRKLRFLTSHLQKNGVGVSSTNKPLTLIVGP